MRTNIIKVGNSKGLILNKTILEKYQIENEVNIHLKDDYLIIEPLNKPRAGWNRQFIEAKPTSVEAPLLPDVFDDERLLEW